MATRKSMWILFGIFAISAWVLAYAIQAGGETLNYIGEPIYAYSRNALLKM